MLKRMIATLVFTCVALQAYAVKPDTAIDVVALHNSGYAHINLTLSRFFDIKNSKISNKSFPLDNLFESGVVMLVNDKDRFMNIDFVPPNQNNIDLFHRYLNKFVLHVRDPRETLASHLFYVDAHVNHPYTRSLLLPNPPDEYFGWSAEQKADWQIQNFYDGMLSWLSQWANRVDHDPALTILETKTEDMLQDQLGFFKRLVAFYGVNPDEFTQADVQPIKPGDYLFYQSTNQETWKERFTPAQQEYITSRIPERLMLRYGWTP